MFYGAKIGVLVLNGLGKSSLLRILAGVDRDFHGENTVLLPRTYRGVPPNRTLLNEVQDRERGRLSKGAGEVPTF